MIYSTLRTATTSLSRLPLSSLYYATGSEFTSLVNRLLLQQLEHMSALLPSDAIGPQVSAQVSRHLSNLAHAAKGGGVQAARMRLEHREMLSTVCQELANSSKAAPGHDKFASMFYRASLGSTTLLDEYVAKVQLKKMRGYIQNVDLSDLVARIAARSVRNLPVNVVVQHQCEGNAAQVLAVEPQLKSILRVAIENAVMASVKANCNHLPVQVKIYEGEEDFCVRVSDEAGGKSYKKMQQVFQWPWHGMSSASGDSRWHGVAAAKIAARFFGGDFDIVSMEGLGTDAFVYISKQQSRTDSFDEEDVWDRIESAWQSWQANVN